MSFRLHQHDLYGILTTYTIHNYEVIMTNRFAIDNSSILYLALIRKDHTNIFRFTLTMSEEIQPELLQTAVNRIYNRFPSIFAGFRPSFFQFTQVKADQPPQVLPDPGCLLTMTREEIARCAYRVYYRNNLIIIEAFHGLSDGYGIAASFCTLAAEYLYLRYGMDIPRAYPVMDTNTEPDPEELDDSYLRYADAKPLHMPSRYSYQLPGREASHDHITESPIVLPVETLLNAARHRGVSITALLSAVMAASVMEVQKGSPCRKLRPVRIMVPIDLRRTFPSKTLRNFILYALPTMEASEDQLSIQELAEKFSRQIKEHLRKENLAGIIAYNVRTQSSPVWKMLPSGLKCLLMRLAYRFFGESNSSITFTNLGTITLPKIMVPYVKDIRLTMTPRARSPYNCGMLSYNGNFFLNICRFPQESRLEEIFTKKLNDVLKDEESCHEAVS